MDLFYPKSMLKTTVNLLLSDLYFSYTSAFFFKFRCSWSTPTRLLLQSVYPVWCSNYKLLSVSRSANSRKFIRVFLEQITS